MVFLALMENRRTPILIYVLLVLAICASAVIVYEAVTLPMLRGAALAQADFELFVVSLVLGLPVVLTCAAILTWVYRTRLVDKRISLIFGDPVAIVSALNIAIVLAGLTFSLLLRQVGFFWL
jgi:hypothetical protein